MREVDVMSLLGDSGRSRGTLPILGRGRVAVKPTRTLPSRHAVSEIQHHQTFHESLNPARLLMTLPPVSGGREAARFVRDSLEKKHPAETDSLPVRQIRLEGIILLSCRAIKNRGGSLSPQ